MKNEQNAKLYAEFMQDMIDGIGTNGDSKWEKHTHEVSTGIRDALVDEISNMERNKNSVDEKFLDYCNAIKSLLALYNFGKLENETNKQSDKALIKTGIKKILNHIEKFGYDITPYFNKDLCREIFGVKDNKVIPVTLSATTVFTTLVYFRRAYKRIKLFTREELIDNDSNCDLMQLTVNAVSELMYLFYDYAYDSDNKNSRFLGWGATLDKKCTKAVNLRDTYLVVCALSRFDDAFTKDGEKRDEDFIQAVDKYSEDTYGFKIHERCLESTYKTSLNIYDSTKDIFGKSVFYSECSSDVNGINYTYTKTTYEQIASSSRSSALFNPLYVAMITMYGYTDKEVVIRQFMDNPNLAKYYHEKYETKCPKNEMKISEYAGQLSGYNGNFENDKWLLLNEHDPMSKRYARDKGRDKKDEDGNESWRDYYDIARLFQKYLESEHPEELLKISDYRDYLNATKDAIDQVHIMYRDFDTHQRLGIVDTDYGMFTTLDVAAGEGTNIISKLNKASIQVNSIRPMLLSSKIMIVNALTKYPQADMSEIYNAILDARYNEISRAKKGDKKWLWDEDAVDMNSTALHCEAIMYDYFDYYETYEQGFKSIQAFRKEVTEFVNKNLNLSNGLIDSDKTVNNASRNFGQLEQLVLEITHRNVDIISKEYQKNIEKMNTVMTAAIQEAKQEAENAKKHAQQQAEAFKESFIIGETVRGWIRAEIDSYLPKILSMSIINILNGNRPVDRFDFDRLLKKENDVIDANFDIVQNTWKNILADCNDDPEKRSEKIAEYNEAFKKVIAFQEILGAASNGLLENDYYKKLGRDDSLSIEERNTKIKAEYGTHKKDGVLSKNDKE